MIVRKEDAFHLSKNGVDMWVYGEGLADAAIVYQETAKGHGEEFRHHTSNFLFFIVEGSGEWVIEDEVFAVKAHDVVVVPKGKRFYYRGALKQVCITAPAWEAEHEEHIRDIAL
jgi:mannose-6-phosphate isomerase-like protein (cupin superfamily)